MFGSDQRGYKDDRNLLQVGIVLNFLAQLVPVHHRHLYVGNNQVGIFGLYQFERIFTVLCGDDFVPFFYELVPR